MIWQLLTKPLVVVAKIGAVCLLDKVAAVLVEQDPGQSVAVVDVDEEAAEDVEAEKSGDLDTCAMTLRVSDRRIWRTGCGTRCQRSGKAEI